MAFLSSKIFRQLKIYLSLFYFFCLIPQVHAETVSTDYTTVNTPRFTLHFVQDPAEELINNTVSVKEIADSSIDILNNTVDELSVMFKAKPTDKVILRFLPPTEFRRRTGAPNWTSAMFYRGEISIPWIKQKGINPKELARALRHEIVHAVVAELSAYHCPAWLDEGIAQIFEGKANPLLGPALRSWIRTNQAMPLSWLQNGFTTLDSKIVPAAYAQSLFATRTIVNQDGYKSIISYLSLLRSGMDENKAFEKAFRQNKRAFEKQLTIQIKKWASSNQKDP